MQMHPGFSRKLTGVALKKVSGLMKLQFRVTASRHTRSNEHKQVKPWVAIKESKLGSVI